LILEREDSMPAKYSVIQFLPDPIAGERINIGVIVFDNQSVQVRFLRNWERVRRFANSEVEFLQDFAGTCTLAASPNLLLPTMERFPRLDEQQILAMAHNWRNSIQLTEPRGSTKPIEALLTEVVARFLVEPSHTKKEYRDKMTAARIARAKVRGALRNRFSIAQADHLLMPYGQLEGKNKPHAFDAVVQNGRPHFAIDALSFELPRATNLDLQIYAKAWTLTDVRDNDPNIPIGIYTLPPLDKRSHLTALYDETVSTYTNIGVDVLTDETFSIWLREKIDSIPVNESNHRTRL
jgi:hypothetical protein